MNRQARWRPTRDALEGKGPQRRPQKRLDRRLEEVAKSVGGGYCQLQVLLTHQNATHLGKQGYMVQDLLGPMGGTHKEEARLEGGFSKRPARMHSDCDPS